ncbi:MAG: RluA family pseudouridine synthase [Patescibacteria group bacterium]|jgi:23S rRNA pseudouridine1911/1915/1917 synthase
MADRKLSFKVLPNEAGTRLDALLVKHHPDRSRSLWSIAIKAGQVMVDGRPAKARHLLKRGQQIVANIPASKPIVSVPIKLSIIHQDKDLLVINKPAGLVMHPAGRHQSGTLLDILEAKFSEVYLVHRLDKDTSGVVLVARNLKNKEYLSSIFAKRLVKKTYLALLVGKVTPMQACLDLPIKRGRSGKFEVAKQGRSAKSFYKVLEYLPGYSLVEVRPESGRTHQIRVHFRSLRHSVVGDEIYGQKISGLSRQFLHAFKIEFVDAAGKARQFTAPLPDELKSFLNELH